MTLLYCIIVWSSRQYHRLMIRNTLKSNSNLLEIHLKMYFNTLRQNRKDELFLRHEKIQFSYRIMYHPSSDTVNILNFNQAVSEYLSE